MKNVENSDVADERKRKLSMLSPRWGARDVAKSCNFMGHNNQSRNLSCRMKGRMQKTSAYANGCPRREWSENESRRKTTSFSSYLIDGHVLGGRIRPCRGGVPALPAHCGPLSCQAELQAQTEVLGCRRVGAAAQKRRVGLAVKIEAHGHQLRQCVVGRERQLERTVAAAGG